MEISINGNDTIILNGTLLTDLGEGDVGVLTFPNELAQMKPGKNGNTVIAFSALGLMGELTLKLLRGSGNDAFINSIQRQFIIDPPSFVTVTAQLVKRLGDGQGNVGNDVYNLVGGVPTNIPEAKSNVEGDVEQGLVSWKFKFAQGSRQLQ
jgi:hypothetical protein